MHASAHPAHAPTEPSEAAPLAGVRVVDLGQYIAGPLTAMILADLGADVVRVDPPGGPAWDHPATRILSRNKRSIALDLTVAEDREAARRLVAAADVVIENFRPGVMERFGLGARELTEALPRLVHLSLPGFASTDEESRDLPAWEAVIAAAIGQFWDMGLNRMLMGVRASFSPLTLASANGAVLGATAVVLALRSRDADGCGDRLEVPLAAALSEALAFNSMSVAGVPSRYLSPRPLEMARRRGAGEPLDLDFDGLRPFRDAFHRTYRCADDREFMLSAFSHVNHQKRALALLGLLDEVLAAGIPTFDPYLPTRSWPEGADCTLYGSPLSPRWNTAIATRMEAVFAQQPSSHWEALFGDGKVASGIVRTTQEWLREEHPVAAGLLVDVEDERYGLLRQPGSMAWIGGLDVARPAARPAPVLDADRDRILDELRAIEAVQEYATLGDAAPNGVAGTSGDAPPAGGWLEGITVLDMTNVIAGPTVTGTLARFGAEVIRLEPARPTFDQGCTVMLGVQSNRGKRTALVDVATGRGRKVLEDLVRRADVVTMNATAQQLVDLGLDPESVAALNPDAVVCHVDTWGGPLGGPWRDRLGYDDVAQATTGIMARFGGGPRTPEDHMDVGTIDTLGGYAGALATAVALYARRRGVDTHLARASLAAVGQVIQLPFMYDHPGRGPFDEPSGPGARGTGPLYRLYEAADGWLFLACAPAELPAVAGELGIDDPTGDPHLETVLEKAFAGEYVDAVVARLRGRGVAAQRVESFDRVRARFMAEAQGGSGSASTTVVFERDEHHPSGHTVELIGRCAVRTARSVITPPTSTPRPGTDTSALLAELGYTDDDVRAMFEAHEISESWSEEYLPT